MQLLKQSTAATVLVGPVLDLAGLPITTAVIGDFQITKNGSSAALASPATATHSHNGNYLIALSTGNTDTAGRLVITVNNSAQAMGSHRFTVLVASVFDAIVTNATNTTGGLPTATGTITALAGAVSTFAGGAVASVTGSVGSISGVTFPAHFSSLDITAGGAIAELGANALTANGAVDAIPTAVWNALTTTTWVTDSFGKHILISNNNNRSVQVTGAGSGHIAADIHALQAGVITSAAFAANWLTAAGLAADAATEIATAVAATQALSRLDSMIESDGAGQFRFDTIALSMAPAGGGGGGTDWTANERTAIRAILGVPTSGTTPTDPTSGILDEIRDSVGAIGINVYPVSASTPERVAGTTITYYRNEIRSVSVVTDFTLTNLTLSLTIEDAEGTDLLTIPNASISRSGQTFTVSIGTSVTSSVGNKRWALRDITGGTNSVIARGVFSVQEAASG
jgi:hypothetical protein